MELSIRGVGGDGIPIPGRGRERRRDEGAPFSLGDGGPDEEPGPESPERGEIAPPGEGEAGRRLDVTA